MYPKRDFRYLIKNNPKDAINAISREPFVEVLYFWKQTGKPKDKYKIYCEGLRQAIAKDRYSMHVISCVKDFPEFHTCVYKGLIDLWLNLKLYYDTKRLYIDTHPPESNSVNMSKTMKIKFLTTYKENVIFSPKAEKIRTLINQFE